MRLGYKLMSEEHAADALVDNAIAAEKAGFSFAAISDHFSPWIEEQGHSPYAWAVLGAIARAAPRLGLMTAVTCPTFRYHPAIVAQSAATIAALSPAGFTLGLGSGERLNEHVVGISWPGIRERQERFSEAVRIIQSLLAGETTTTAGRHFRVDKARLFDVPAKKPPVILAAGGPVAARLAGELGDGMIATEPRKDLVEAYLAAGGQKDMCFAEVAMCFAESEDAAKQTAHTYFRWSLTGWPVQAELPDTKGFAAASAHITPAQVGEKITCGPSAQKHADAIRTYIDAGFTNLILVQIGPDQGLFLRKFTEELAPLLSR